MDMQTLINLVIGAAAAALGWFVKLILKTIDRLDQDIRAMPDKYISKSDFKEHLQRIEASLERIFAKLDDKQDK